LVYSLVDSTLVDGPKNNNNMKVENFKYNSDNIKEGDCCPECNALWDGGDIYEHFLEAKFNPNHEQHNYYKDRTIDEIKETAGGYGWTEETKVRFGKVIGMDCSMDPLDESEDGKYDGVSYWQCPKCQIAWHRFKGTRTDRFVKSAQASVIKKLNELEEENDKESKIIIYNAMQTPDGTIIESTHRHDYTTHIDKNGETYMVDGGNEYLKRSVNEVPAKDLTMYLEDWTPEFHEKARKVVKRGGRGKSGDQPLTWVPICEMNDGWVAATIDYNTDRGAESHWFTYLLVKEVEYREKNSITIEEQEV